MLEPRVLVLDVLLHSTLVPRRQRVVEHRELIFHICVLSYSLTLSMIMWSIRSLTHRTALGSVRVNSRFFTASFHAGCPDGPITIAPGASSQVMTYCDSQGTRPVGQFGHVVRPVTCFSLSRHQHWVA
jgi:hypothetical protein